MATMKIRRTTIRIALTILLLVVIAPALFLAYRICRAEYRVRTKGDLESYIQAIQLDPANGEYWWMRGRFHHYDLESMNVPVAIADYERALQLNPRIGKAWLDLSDAYEKTGLLQKAESALQNAMRVYAFSPSVRWQAGNFYLIRGDLQRMYECFKMASEYDIEKLNSALQLVWEIDPDSARIERDLIPQNLPSYLLYLNFLISHDELDLAKAVWEKSLRMPIPDRFQYRASSAFGLIDHLLMKNRIEEAVHVWQQDLQKEEVKGIHSNFESIKQSIQSETNLIWNGSFEEEILNGGFDWRLFEIPEVEVQTVLNESFDGLKCLRIRFSSSNVAYFHLRQALPILNPGIYRFEYCAKTIDLTSDQRPYFALRAFPENGTTYFHTEMLPANSSWQKYSYEFRVEPETKALQLVLIRDLSTKLGNQIQGTLWLDSGSIGAIGPNAVPHGNGSRF
jgi:tetratricopeptide (TPR) repeat protein